MKPPEYKVALAGSERAALPGFRPLRRANSSLIIQISVVLRPRSSSQISDSISEMAAQLLQERHYLTREEFAAAHGADVNDVRKVLRFAARHGLRVVNTNEAARTLQLQGTVAAISRAFGVALLVYQRDSPQGVERYRGRTGPIYIPAELEGIVQAVMGLDNRPQARAHLRNRPEFGGGWPQGGTVSYSPDQLARHYNFPDGFAGEGQCIGIIALGGGYSPRDLEAYFERLESPAPRVSSVFIHGAQNRAPLALRERPSEVTFGIQVAGAVAPGVHIVVYFAPATTNGFFEAITRAVHDEVNRPSILAISWGRAEAAWTPQSLRAFDQAFQAAVAMGVTVCCAAGDRGSSDGNPGRLAHATFPASSPYVLACGGTRLSPTGDETVWNDGPGNGAGGGGVSDFFGLPPWQQNAGIPLSVNASRFMGRGLPDVAANASPMSGYQVRANRIDTVIGGTSAACLLWAGLVARLNQHLGASVGFLNPLLYQRVFGEGFTDILAGDNDLTGHVGGYEAGPGWDACTGWGTPHGMRLADALR
jgi:kumamolisin